MIGKTNEKKYDLSFLENIFNNEIKHVKENWFLFLVCFFISRQNIIDEIFPFAIVVLCSYSNIKGSSLLMLGTTILAILSVRFDFVYIIMLIAVYAYFFNFRNEDKKPIMLIAFYAGAVLFVSKTTILVADGFNINGLVLNFFETLFVFSAIVLINEIVRSLSNIKKVAKNKNIHRFKRHMAKDEISESLDSEFASAISDDKRLSSVVDFNKAKFINIFSEKAKAKIKEQLLWQNINVKFFEVVSSNKNTIVLSVTVKTEKSSDEAESAIELIARNVCGVKLRCTERVIASPNYYVLKFKNIKRIKIRTYSATAIKDGSAVSGDSFAYAGRADRYYTVLCDGIGSGQEAFNESNGAVDLLSKFLYTDFSEEQILRTLNSILMLKFEDEHFVTFDLSIIDYGTKAVRFYKAGAAPTYIVSSKNVEKLSGKSLPMGILDNFEYSSFKKEIKIGDIIVMVSDGIIDSINMDSKKSLDKYLELIAHKDPQTIANSVLSYALRGQNTIIDDMTVLVTKIG
ncbi:MAG: SpoIIE family protein phosphatase [Sedimentibacter sp.]|uniref:SpoIIE family protein phosphatase n=1 Tax=Sedimentibacter sp. TaxID=1960295 RepID=UPI002982B08D|nr:SpoIIE family protein phosphatase [Sedimentibacter sp.]MDW5298661.1 SpoIIE family protein phosphatase [Sedimentibacter sp.]